uniref:Uncharacterized protein n=1 Tax=Nelumbo nucifera TaxID=4432 RepID=A0A822ZJF2_NELNU|nr:TPA_asm: hypothetical protein HUJ06_003492 [Nelumbo nucifera]
MSGAPRVRSINVADSEARPVLGPAGNKTRSLVTRKPASKPLRKVEKTPEAVDEEKKAPSSPVAASPPKLQPVSVPSILRRHEFLHSNLSLNASCSSDASSDSVYSRASTGRLIRTRSTPSRRKYSISRPEKVVPDSASDSSPDSIETKKRCAWVTPNTGMYLVLSFKVFLRFLFHLQLSTFVLCSSSKFC